MYTNNIDNDQKFLRQRKLLFELVDITLTADSPLKLQRQLIIANKKL